MVRLPGPNREWLVLTFAGLAALAGGCDRHHAAPILPTGEGGTLAADISASSTSGRAPLDITFTSNVHGGDEAYRYEWSFGDGRTSTAANPRVQFVSGGTFDVRLKVWSGDQTASAGPLSLRLDSDVRLSCSAEPGEGVAPASVAFRADPSGGTGAFTYRWDFGDGTSSTERSPVHTYASPGSYLEVLTVASGGASAVCSNVVTVYGTFRMLSCKATPTGGGTVQFHATPSFCLFDDCAYEWDFGGSGGGFGLRTARPLFTYDASGTYTATLSASTDQGQQAASCGVTVTVP
jgi:PKD repeat protein